MLLQSARGFGPRQVKPARSKSFAAEVLAVLVPLPNVKACEGPEKQVKVGSGKEVIDVREKDLGGGNFSATFTPNDLSFPRKGSTDLIKLYIGLKCKSEGFYELQLDFAGLSKKNRFFKFNCRTTPIDNIWNIKQEHNEQCIEENIALSSWAKDLCGQYNKK